MNGWDRGKDDADIRCTSDGALHISAVSGTKLQKSQPGEERVCTRVLHWFRSQYMMFVVFRSLQRAL